MCYSLEQRVGKKTVLSLCRKGQYGWRDFWFLLATAERRGMLYILSGRLTWPSKMPRMISNTAKRTVCTVRYFVRIPIAPWWRKKEGRKITKRNFRKVNRKSYSPIQNGQPRKRPPCQLSPHFMYMPDEIRPRVGTSRRRAPQRHRIKPFN